MKTSHKVLCAAILMSFSVPALAQDELANALPSSTVLLIRIRDVQDFLADVKKSPIYAKRDEGEFAGMTTAIREAWNKMKQSARSEVDVDLEELLSSVHGDITFVVGSLDSIISSVVQASSTFEEPEIRAEDIPLLLTFDTEDAQESFAKNWKKLLDAGRSQGAKVEERSFQGGKITTVGRPDDATEGPEKILFGELETRYFMGFNTELLERTMANLKSGRKEGSLGEVDAFKTSMREAVGNESDVLAYVNVASVVSALDASLRDHMFGIFWQKARDLLIGKSLNSIAVSFALDAGGVVERIFVHNAGAKDGMLGWLQGTVPAQPTPLVPKEALAYSALALDFGQVFKLIREIFAVASQMAPGLAGQTLDSVFEQNLGISLADFERAFGDRIYTFQTSAQTADNPLGNLGLIIELENEGPVKQLLGKLAQLSGGELSEEKYLGRDIYVAPSGPVQPALFAADKLFVFGVERPLVEMVIRRIGESSGGLAEESSFQKVASFYPKQGLVMMSYTDSKLLEESFKAMAQTMQLAATDAPEWIFGVIGHVGGMFGTSTGYSLWREQGLYSEGRLPYSTE